MTFDQYLQSLGWYFRPASEGAGSWYNSEKETNMIVGSEQYAGLQDQFNAISPTLATSLTSTPNYQGWAFVDEAGQPRPAGEYVLGPNSPTVTINGQQYYQFGSAGANPDDWTQYGGGVITDPTYGVVVPQSTYLNYQSYVDANRNTGGFWGGLNSFLDAGGLVGLGSATVGGLGLSDLLAGTAIGEIAGPLAEPLGTAITESAPALAEPALAAAIAPTAEVTGLAEPTLASLLEPAAATTAAAGTGALTQAEIDAIISAEGGYSALPSIGMEGTAIPATALDIPTIPTPVSTPTGSTPPSPTQTATPTPPPSLQTAASVAGAGAALANTVNNPDGSTTITDPYDGSTLTINPDGTYTSTPTTDVGGTSGVPDAASAASAVSWLAKTLGISEGALRALGITGATALGLMGASSQTNTLRDIYNQFNAQGAPSRARFEGSFAPGYSIWDDPATRDAAARAADISARSYSSRMGNPFDNPTAQAGIYSDVLRSVALPQLNTYRSQQLQGGGMGSTTAGTAAIGGAQAGGGVYDALGYGLSSLLNPPTDWQTLLKQLGSGSNNIF